MSLTPRYRFQSSLQNDFEVDDDGISYVISSVFIGDEEEEQKCASVWMT